MGSMPFDLRYPGTVLFGWGRRQELPALLRVGAGGHAPRVLLVASAAVVGGARAEEWERLCGNAVCARGANVPHDPPLESVEALVGLGRERAAEAVVAVGGGSVLDAAKAAALLIPAGVDLRACFRGEAAPTGPGLPLYALPTTAGSGAEITQNAVLTDRAAGVKQSIRSPWMVARAAIIDPELTVSLPAGLTAATGVDALTQALESYLSLRAHAVSRALAREAVRLLLVHLAQAVRDGADREARTRVAEGSLLSAMAFSQSGLGAVHGLAHPLGVALDLPHGVTCGVLLPAVLAWNAPVCQGLLADLAGATGHGSAAGFVEAVGSLCREVGIPADLAGRGLGPEVVERVVAGCRSNSMKTNPRPMSDDEVRALLVHLAG